MSPETAAQNRAWSFVIEILLAKWKLRRLGKRGRHRDDLRPWSDYALTPSVPGKEADCLDRFAEWLRKMSLIQNNEAVHRHQAGVNGSHFGADPIAAKQQSRAKLIHRG